jgi:hypothetical protein
METESSQSANQELEAFDKTFADILNQLTNDSQDPGIKEALNWFRRVRNVQLDFFL